MERGRGLRGRKKAKEQIESAPAVRERHGRREEGRGEREHGGEGCEQPWQLSQRRASTGDCGYQLCTSKFVRSFGNIHSLQSNKALVGGGAES
jgi:hypothetical protein